METKKIIVIVAVFIFILITAFKFKSENDLQFIIQQKQINEYETFKVEIRNNSTQNYFILLDTLMFGYYETHSYKDEISLYPTYDIFKKNKKIHYEFSISDWTMDYMYRDTAKCFKSIKFVKLIPAKQSINFNYTFSRFKKFKYIHNDTLEIEHNIPNGCYKISLKSNIDTVFINKKLNPKIKKAIQKLGYIPYQGEIISNKVNLVLK